MEPENEDFTQAVERVGMAIKAVTSSDPEPYLDCWCVGSQLVGIDVFGVPGREPKRLNRIRAPWKKPSRPEGVPVWSDDGIICIGEALKNAVRLTFPKGAHLRDPKGLFNTRLDSRTVRAIDFHDGDAVNASALKKLVLEGARLNRSWH